MSATSDPGHILEKLPIPAEIPAAGTVIGHHDGPGLGEPVTTPYDDCLLVMPSTRQAREGVTVVRFARRAPMPMSS